MKTRPEWPSLTGLEILDEIKIRRDLIGRMVGQLYPSILADEVAELQALYENSAFKRGRRDCYQDRCENCHFSSVGGLDKRAAMEAPDYVKKNGEQYTEEYLAGYRAEAEALFGKDWMTCTFEWQHAITIEREQP